MEKENLTRQKYVIQKLPLWALAHALRQKNRAIHTQEGESYIQQYISLALEIR